MHDMDVVDKEEQYAEWARCIASPWHFIKTKCHIYQSSDRPQDDEDGNNYDPTSSTGGKWVPFELWPSQIQPLNLLHKKRKVILLKARQIGMTWLALAYSLWMLLFMENVTILLFSRGDREAMDLLRRLIEMFKRLPRWMMPEGSYREGVEGEVMVTGVAGHTWKLPNGSRVMAFPSSAGDSYSASMAVIDEADLVPDLDKLLGSVKPTVDGGGKLVMISRVDKKKPTSPFKRMCRAAMAGLNGFAFCFLPWYSDPRRTLAFYKDQVADSMTRMFSMDAAYEQYPATPEEALAPNQLDKRFPEMALAPCFVDAPDLRRGGTVDLFTEWDNPKYDKNRPEVEPNPKYNASRPEDNDNPREILNPKKLRAFCPKLNHLRVYVTPKPGRSYTLSVDPAQGLPGSDDSSIVVIDDETKEECAHLRGKIDPRSIGRQAAEICDWYRKPTGAKCTVVIERNNHGHATIGWWHDNRREGLDASLWLDKDQFPGWVQTGQSKEVMWHRASDAISRKNCIIHSRDLYDQIASIEAATLEAPEGQLDDSAVAWGLCMAVSGLKKKLGWMGLKLPNEQVEQA